MIYKLRNILIVMAVVAILLAIIFNEFLAYSAIFVGAMIVFYALYSAFLRTKDEEIDSLRAQLEEDEEALEKIKQENEELRSRKLNMAAVKQILDVGLFEVDTNFTRTWNEELTTDMGKEVQFIGALKVNITAKYGVDLTQLRIKHTGDEVKIANMHLKPLSFTDLDYDWTIAEVLEYKKPYLGSRHRRTNDMLQLEANKIKERLQKRIHEEVKNGPEEMNAVIEILKKQLIHSIAAVLGLQDKKVHFVEETDASFKELEGIKTLDR
jgi:hypothetical protein